jgi:hypothetical protein
VGAGRSILVLTADHGATPDPRVMDGYVIDPRELQADLDRRFGDPSHAPIVTGMSPTEIWLNNRSLEALGYTAYDVSRFLLDYTVAKNGGPTAPDGGRRVFLTAFPTNLEPGEPAQGHFWVQAQGFLAKPATFSRRVGRLVAIGVRPLSGDLPPG